MNKRKDYLLTDNGVKSIAKQSAPDKVARHSDGNSLYLIQHPNGSLFWQMSYRYQSDKDIQPKQKTYQIGIYKSSKQAIDASFKPQVSLKQARIERDKAKALLTDGIDPTVHKGAEKNNFEQKDLFKAIAKSYIDEKSKTTAKNVQKLQGFLDNHILKHLGSYPIGAITAQDIIKTGLAIQASFEQQGKHTSETAHKCMGLISSIFEYAINTLGYDITNLAIGRNKALRPHKAERMKAVEQHQFPDLLRNIDQYISNHPNAHAQTVAGLQLMTLCFVRTKELRHFEWSEIDYHKSVWRIPAAKMKMRQDHIIPLSPQAMAIIERMRPLTEQTGYVFYNFESNKPYSEAWFNQALQRMGYTGDPYPKMTGHGFRQLASTGLYELQFSESLIEIQLAHLEQSSVRRRYDLSEHLAERQMMMHRWANYLDDLRAGKMISFDLLTPDELAKEMNSRNEQATDIALHDKDILIKSLQAQGVSPEVLAKLAEQL
ncbi:tyrosine-type recombinase/integrase [Psychrobacter sp. Ps4]|uniref:tyrosine-type recombinase/integrase n=1 Tax=Psychrobacter sp. Ps4 TaxID=2790958 RepID=UPI001EDD1564|nr:tyrosine-type recombinase/integrase [Psychrobacter sp. Ps4]MCG3809588.1 tyrosine-type recombinase/integrase [Psychrobacter sp. Ps4]